MMEKDAESWEDWKEASIVSRITDLNVKLSVMSNLWKQIYYSEYLLKKLRQGRKRATTAKGSSYLSITTRHKKEATTD